MRPRRWSPAAAGLYSVRQFTPFHHADLSSRLSIPVLSMQSKRRSEVPQRLDDTQGAGPLEGAGTRGDAQFHIGVAQMRFYRIERKMKVGRDVDVRRPLGKLFEHPYLSLCERVG